MNIRRALVICGLLGAVSVALGALGAHWLKNQLPGGRITPDQVAGFDTAARYQMYHTLAMLLVALLYLQRRVSRLKWAFNLFLSGIVLFSGSLYLLCTRNLFDADFLRLLSPVTPLGGLCFIGGWICVMIAFYGKKDWQED
jgi:uncharacterized membrane protein YgdD (TMEM256/DUF423 family)